MESQDLRIFKCVAEEKSLSKAAEVLGYVQPHISQRIKKLEEELGTKLLTRTNRGVTLTHEGEALFNYAQRILLLMEEAKAEVNPNKFRKSLIIGASQTVSAIKIPSLFSSFLKEHQNIEVKIKTDRKQVLQEMLSYGEIDGLFLSGTYNEAQFETVYHYAEKMVLISPLYEAREEKDQPALLINSDVKCIYRNRLLEFSKEHHIHKANIMEFDSLEAILQGVRDGLGMSVVPASVVNSRGDMKSIEYQELSEDVHIDFVVKKGKQRSQSLEKFIHFLGSL
ncbi:LysR family transcriptional regulator [Priestia megaterium]|uniref:LysR family transcriptional regulator n=1 Tax=Priestia megaterium TaxID=1404 RepID=UPI0013E3F304|nr:LysR family transcriptional regulator [Priestia megaterium]MED3866057.1 LysR family transcriptional regulator [Priestia megaterium]MED4101688.1 LysR family transcriptional regulator [Priestia megaterium]MED4145725.1 LysR family transcriptional regulator [Priestia megaterium]MED4166430.1 LysR family transcriptional regulator [Priestia megaterium]MED4199620.1 LysR family transcriptional regulator [Priestia megaterium]